MKKVFKISTFFLIFCVNFVKNSGFFEIQLIANNINNNNTNNNNTNSNRNSDIFGNNWTKVSICLKEMLNRFQFNINSLKFSSNECTFGEKTEQIIQNNNQNAIIATLPSSSSSSSSSASSSSSRDSHSIRIPFTFRWTGSFSLILEIQSQTESKPERHFISDSDAYPNPNQTNQWKYRTLHQPLSLRYRLSCDHNYYGKDCATFCRPRDDTFGHYLCDKSGNGKKVCVKGWKEENCDKPKCREGCNEMHGFCELPGECTCRNGWKGIHCNECVEYPGCLHGYCLSPFQCICHRNWGGILCEQDLNYCGTHDPCLNDGQCQNVAPDHYRCLCRPGFQGINCQTVVDSCATAPCLHAGTCISKHNGSDFTCQCVNGFEGKRCERDVNECLSDPCLNGGACHDLHNHFKCQCAQGWTGRRCEEDVDECETLRPCVRAQKCVNTLGQFECICEKGFEGKQCETEVNECEKHGILCQNGGQCLDLLDDFRCVCIDHFSGQFCQHLDKNVCNWTQEGDTSSGIAGQSLMTSPTSDQRMIGNEKIWRFDDNRTTTQTSETTECPKLCLCSRELNLKCSQMCVKEEVFKCDQKWPKKEPEVNGYTGSETEIKLIFEPKISKKDNICGTLAQIHSLVTSDSTSGHFCCKYLSEAEVLVNSDHVSDIRRYISNKLFPELRQILSINNVKNMEKGAKSSEEMKIYGKTIFYTIFGFLAFFVLISVFIYFLYKKRKNVLNRNERENGIQNLSNEVVINCIQNNLRNERKKRNENNISIKTEKNNNILYSFK